MGRTVGKPYQVVRWMQVIDGPRIARQRKRKDLTQRQLAFLVGTSQTTIYLLETGGMRTLTEKLALAIAKRLDLPWEDPDPLPLVGGRGVAAAAARSRPAPPDVRAAGKRAGAPLVCTAHEVRLTTKKRRPSHRTPPTEPQEVQP
jgi:putative transcriptional regulator